MKRSLLLLLLFGAIGCEVTPNYWETEVYGEAVNDRKAMLMDGRIYIGMKDWQFAKLWGRPHDEWIDRSVYSLGVVEWWKYGRRCNLDYSGPPTYYFCFESGILTYWTN